MSHPPDSAASTWPTVHLSPGQVLTDARLQLHHAAQVANAPAISYNPPAADDSHTNFGWFADLRAFVSQRVELPQPRRFGWRPEDLTLLALDDATQPMGSFPLAGSTLADAHAWAQSQCVAAEGVFGRYTAKKHYEIPDHGVRHGSRFGADATTLRTLAQLWANVVPRLEMVAAAQATGATVRLWPHHFDVGALLTVDARRSIGIGFTPGDSFYDEPYWYVSPHPGLPAAPRPALAGGGLWHDHEFFSAVLPWSALTASDLAQGDAVTAYLDSALDGARATLAP